ncbi:serine/threonine-protein kinase [Candidatus Uabimicrobium amorphum]|uniref:Protein kinase n=1 Tax=Uabimicrobium amorphum TaxID=2596890 RepID=A0A5S9F6U1_UABAM|nr:serine/threonine-protein kinase [Candidatus Uabimicrobium amorphum]BBM88022.1 protein kinase [Candidatus Uabimicrobium amorphum]
MTKTIGKYTIIGKLGEGGMGTVHLAYDETLKRKVAIKHINDKSSYYIKRMMREAQSIGSLVHPHILKIYEIIMVKNFPCLVMEYIDGVTLNQYMEQNTLTITQKVELFIKILHAANCAHQQNIVHRDIKPQNIMMDKKHEPYLMDFGLAKRMKVDATLTKTGMLMGSPTYMSPEQADGETRKLNHLSDIYSLGVVFYELIGNVPAVSGENVMEILRKVSYENPTLLRKINKDTPYAIECIAYKALQKNPKNRYQSAMEFANDLQKFLQHKAPMANMWRIKSKVQKFLIPVCICVAMILAVWFSQNRRDSFDLRITSPQDILQNAQNLINYGLDEDALRQLTSLQKKINLQSPLRQPMHLAMIEIYKRQKKWYKLETLALRYFRGKNILQADLALAHMYFEQGDWKKARKYLNHKVSSTHFLATDFYYLKAKIFYKTKRYEEVISTLLKSLKTNKNSELQPIHSKQIFSRLLLGKAYFQAYQESKKKFHLQQAKDILNDLKQQLPNNPDVYEYLGRSLLIEKSDLPQAQSYFQKCIDLTSGRARYYNLLAEVDIARQDFVQAYKYIIEAVKLDPRNNIASTAFLDLAYQNPQQKQEYYMTMTFYSKNFDKVTPPDCIAAQVEELEKNYRDAYERLQWWRTKHNAKKLNIQKSFFRTMNQLRSYLNLIRHHHNMEEQMRSYIAKEFSDSSEYLEILNTFIKKKQRELAQANYYRLARWYLHRDRKMLLDWTQSGFATEDKKSLRSILTNENENIIYRYLAAKALLNSQDTQYTENYLNTTPSTTAKLITCMAYRSESISVEIAPIVHYLKQKQALSPLKLLAIHLLYLNGEHVETSTLSLLQDLLLSRNEQSVRMQAAQVIFAIRGMPQKLWAQAENVLLQTMDSNKVQERFFAHYYFWQNNYVKQRMTKYWPYYAKAWQETHEPIISSMILLARSKIFDQNKVNVIAQFMARYIESERQKSKHISVSRLQAIKTLYFHFPYYQPLDTQGEHPIARILSYNSEIFKRSSKSWKPNTAIQTMRFLKKNLRKMQNKRSHDRYYKLFVYYISAIFGFHTLDSFDRENDIIKAHVLQNLCYLKYGILRGLQNQNNPLASFVLQALNQEIKDKWSDQQKLQFVNKHLESSNKLIRSNALLASYVYSNSEGRQRLFDSYLQKSKTEKIIFAQSIHGFVKLMTFSRFLAADEIQSLNTQYYTYIASLQDKSKRKMHKKVLKHLNRAIQLDPDNITYKFEKAIIQSAYNQLIQSVFTWEKIVESHHAPAAIETIMSRLKLAEYYTQNESAPQATIKVKNLFGNPIKKEILAQDNLFLLRVVQVYAKLQMWSEARDLFEKIFFRNPSRKTLFLPKNDLNENDQSRVQRYLRYF